MPPKLETIMEYDNEAGQRSVLAVDHEGHMYWNGRPVIVERGITLTTWQKIGAMVTVTAAGLGGLWAFLQIVTWFSA